MKTNCGATLNGGRTLAAQLLDTARALKMALVEIHPAVEQCGATGISELVGRMKKDVDAISERAEAATYLHGMALDVDGLADELAGRLGEFDPSEMSNRQLIETIMAAEFFVARGRSYLDSRMLAQEAKGVIDVADAAC